MRRNGKIFVKNSRNPKPHKGIIRIFKLPFKLGKVLFLPVVLLLILCWLLSFLGIGLSWLDIPFFGNGSTTHTELNLNTSESISNTNSHTTSTPMITDNYELSFATDTIVETANPTVTLKPTTTVTTILTVAPTSSIASTIVPTATLTCTPTPTPVPTPTATCTPTPTPVPTPTPTCTPTPTPIPTPTATCTPTPTPVPTPTATCTPTPTPVLTPTATCTPTTTPVSTVVSTNISEATKTSNLTTNITGNPISTVAPTSTDSQNGNLQFNRNTITPSPRIPIAPLPTTPPIANYSSVTEITLDIPLLTQLLSCSNQEMVLYNLITLSIQKDTLTIECDLCLVEFFVSIDTLEYMNNSNIKYINVQGIKNLSVSSIFSCAKDYDVSKVHVLWKKDAPNETYKMGIVMEQSLLAIIFNGFCNYDLTN